MELSAVVVIASVIFSFVFNWIAWIICSIFKTEKLYDITGTLTYLVLIFGSLFYCHIYNHRQILVSILSATWTLRLGLFLLYRVFKTGGDKRFDELKQNPIKFLIPWTLQGLWAFLTVIGVVIINSTETNPASIPSDVIGSVLWFIGFCCETTADFQKLFFKLDSNNKGKFIDDY
eukprot:NODE_4727_length_1124_cov_32.107892_g4192_i0.p1 GENE.NODE_4727_length_1124_cov_32.107892_g4192_i0~~NODE_4727_length_1124_cov_32.107892_g4192_i0.p1  ORF type:complete len:192 (+),score=15.27 NODE_4727_length_1124_cov_32.107892_g4192_i0:52-576(+)